MSEDLQEAMSASTIKSATTSDMKVSVRLIGLELRSRSVNTRNQEV